LPSLEERRVYLENLEFRRTLRNEMNTEACINSILTIAKSSELRVVVWFDGA
jgi:hypothetical protein